MSTFGKISEIFKNVTPRDVSALHKSDDVDAHRLSHHHTLGLGPTQAAPGQDTDKRLKAAETRVTDLETKVTALQADVDAFKLPPRIIRRDTSALSIANTTFTIVAFETDVYTYDITDNNAGTFTVHKNGTYRINASIGFVADGTGRRLIRLSHNGTERARDEKDTNAANPMSVSIAATLPMVAGDTFDIQGWHNAGAALALSASAVYNHLEVVWEGPN